MLSRTADLEGRSKELLCITADKDKPRQRAVLDSCLCTLYNLSHVVSLGSGCPSTFD